MEDYQALKKGEFAVTQNHNGMAVEPSGANVYDCMLVVRRIINDYYGELLFSEDGTRGCVWERKHGQWEIIERF